MLMNVQNPAPYPPLGIERRDPSILPILNRLYAGGQGELTATLSYQYQTILLARKDPRLSQILSDLAASESCHLEILGRLIVLLGGNPTYRDLETKQFWTGQWVSPWRSEVSCRMLLQDLQREVEAADRYLAVARRMPDRKIAAMLRRMAMDEVTHGQVLRELIQNRCPRQPPLRRRS